MFGHDPGQSLFQRRRAGPPRRAPKRRRLHDALGPGGDEAEDDEIDLQDETLMAADARDGAREDLDDDDSSLLADSGSSSDSAASSAAVSLDARARPAEAAARRRLGAHEYVERLLAGTLRDGADDAPTAQRRRAADEEADEAVEDAVHRLLSRRPAADADGDADAYEDRADLGTIGEPPVTPAGSADTFASDDAAAAADSAAPLPPFEPVGGPSARGPGGPSAWLKTEAAARALRAWFRAFFLRYPAAPPPAPRPRAGGAKYEQLVRAACARGATAVEVGWGDVARFSEGLAALLAEVPALCDAPLCAGLTDAARELGMDEYVRKTPQGRLTAQLSGLPEATPIRELRSYQVGRLVRVVGVVVRRAAAIPQVVRAVFVCTACGAAGDPVVVTSERDTRPSLCARCGGGGPFRLHQSRTRYQLSQTLTLQESPGDVPPGRIPRSVTLRAVGECVDACRPGQVVDVTGVLNVEWDALACARSAFPIFASHVSVTHIAARDTPQATAAALTDAELTAIRALSRRPDCVARLAAALAPPVHGHEKVKLGLLLALVGGVAKAEAGHRVRGDINVLMVGDPGCAKSQLLRHCEKAAARAVSTTGRGSTAVGLTAAVRRDAASGGYVLEGGALVSADGGVCMIDEFDKMQDADRVSVHEAMEQQTISVAKAGIVATLSARCAVIAAANPLRGQYDVGATLAANVDFGAPILQRFDLAFAIVDRPDRAADAALAAFVLRAHAAAHPDAQLHGDGDDAGAGATAEEAGAVPHDLLRKYIAFARSRPPPRVDVDEARLVQLYADLRGFSALAGGMPIGVRQIEAIVRLTEAHARLRLADATSRADETAALQLWLGAYSTTLKDGDRRGLKALVERYVRVDEPTAAYLAHTLRDRFGRMHAYSSARGGTAAPGDVPRLRVDVFVAGVRETYGAAEQAVQAFIASPQFAREFVLEGDGEDAEIVPRGGRY